MSGELRGSEGGTEKETGRQAIIYMRRLALCESSPVQFSEQDFPQSTAVKLLNVLQAPIKR